MQRYNQRNIIIGKKKPQICAEKSLQNSEMFLKRIDKIFKCAYNSPVNSENVVCAFFECTAPESSFIAAAAAGERAASVSGAYPKKAGVHEGGVMHCTESIRCASGIFS